MAEAELWQELQKLKNQLTEWKRELDYLLDLSNAHHVWQYPEEQNVDATHSMSVNLYLPPNAALRHIRKVYARIQLLPLRAYDNATTAIVEGISPDGCTISINSTDRTTALTGGATFATDQDQLDITQYMTATGYNTIALTSTQLGRFRLTVWANVFLNQD